MIVVRETFASLGSFACAGFGGGGGDVACLRLSFWLQQVNARDKSEFRLEFMGGMAMTRGSV